MKLFILFFTLLWLNPFNASELAAADFVQPLTQGEVLKLDYTETTTPPDTSAAWQPFSFDQRLANEELDLITVWFRTEFKLDQRPEEPLKLYLPRLFQGGVIYLNETLLTRIPGADPQTQARWLRPHLINLPLDSLQAGRNSLLLKVDTRWPSVGLGTPLVGTSDRITPEYDQRYFIEQELIVISATVLLMGALFLLVIWLRRPKEVSYALFGLAMLAWGLRSSYNLWPLIPMDYWLLSRAGFYAVTGFGNILLCLFILRAASIHHSWLERLALVYAALGPLAMLILDDLFVKWDALWYLGAMPLNVFAVVAIARAAWFQRNWDQVALAVGMGLGVAAFLHDTLVQAGWMPSSGFYLSHVAVPLILCSMGLVLTARFTEALQREENTSQELAARVKQKEESLKASYETVRKMEAEQVRTQERQRIMRDMHDGLGSQLLSSLILVESGEADHKQVAQLLRECLDDMRLVIDTLSLDEEDLVTALGTLRFRMAPRLNALGIDLQWDLQGLSDDVKINPDAILVILRIVQEALSNVLKHAKASKVQFTLQNSEEGLSFSMVDDGCGFNSNQSYPGKGLTNMQHRAASIDAQLSINSDASGTGLHFHKRLECHADQ
ncbi:ATP-binding protein [Marinospirillum sp.]|uniref:sensor histidine kinase n=1 Tax=Marinospirillum sp. TaxID=2183934 RepID=UPI00384E2A9E